MGAPAYGGQVPNPLFSSYRTGENRVTSSTLAVFERIDLALVREILEGASDSGAELSTVDFDNQVVGPQSVPDARISANFTWWFETKTGRGGYAAEGHDRNQVRGHAALLVKEQTAWLFVLTPDPARPAWFAELDGIDEAARTRIVWVGFKQLADAIHTLTSDAARLIGEQTRFLLMELVALYDAEGLLTNDDTVIVAARLAWPEYQATSAYVCQPDRAFREGLTHLGFYAEGAIQPLVPTIREHIPSVLFTRAEATAQRAKGNTELGDLVDALLDNGSRTEGESFAVLLLSGPTDPGTVTLPDTIKNDTLSASGRRWAWTLGQRYTSLDRLRSGASFTSQI